MSRDTRKRTIKPLLIWLVCPCREKVTNVNSYGNSGRGCWMHTSYLEHLEKSIYRATSENAVSAPLPDTLDAAEKRIYELMEESIFFSFVSSVSTTSQSYNPSYHRDSDEFPSMQKASLDDRGIYRSRSSRHRSPPTATIDFSQSTLSPNRGSGRPNSSSLTSGLGRSNSRLSAQANHQSDSGLTDDSGSASSPGREPMTPPTTPPSSDMGSSPRNRNDKSTWKTMGQKLGWKKKSSGGLRPMEEEE
jgi:hypothetical protein